jgi:acetylornithine deacetylase
VELARFVAGWLEAQALDVALEEVASGRANVVARARGSGGGRTLLLNAHLDTVGLGGMADGLRPRIEDGRLYGRGAYDMKASLAALMLAVAEAQRLELAGDVVLAAVADEEAGSIGTEAIARTVRADGAIVAEPTDLKLALAHKGFAWFELETTGRAAHGSRYDLGVDAIALMGHVLVALDELDERLRADGTPHPLLGGPSLHASLIEGGRELSTYPDRCVLTIERRLLPDEPIEAVEEQIRAAASGVDAQVRLLFSREPLETSRAEPIVEAVLSAGEAVLGHAPEIVGVPFWTDAGLLAAAGIPSVVIGPRGEGAHADVEWVDLDSVAQLYELVLEAARGFCASRR